MRHQCPYVHEGERCQWSRHVGQVHYVARAVMDNNGTPSAEELAAMHPELVTPWHVRAGAALEKVVTVAIGVVMIAAMIAALACIAMLCVWGVVEVARGIAR